HEDGLVTLVEQVPERDAVGLGTAIGHLYVVRRRAGIEVSDERTEFHGAVGLRVTQLLCEDGLTLIVCFSQLLNTQWVNAAFGEIPGDAVLPRRLQTFHGERFEAHDRPVYLNSRGPRCTARRRWAILAGSASVGNSALEWRAP